MSEKYSLFEDSYRRHNKNGTSFSENFDQSDQRCSHFVNSHRRRDNNDTTFAVKFRSSDTTIPLAFPEGEARGIILGGFPMKSRMINDGIAFFALYHPRFRKQLGVDRGVLGVALDEVAARFHIIAHQHREDVIGFGSVLNRHEFQHARFGIHCGIP